MCVASRTRLVERDEAYRAIKGREGDFQRAKLGTVALGRIIHADANRVRLGTRPHSEDTVEPLIKMSVCSNRAHDSASATFIPNPLL